MPRISLGSMFAIPLPEEGTFAYGYIAFLGDFYYSNIYDRTGIEAEPPRDIEDSPIIIRDLMHDRSPFLPRMKKLGRLSSWPLAKQRVLNPLPPESRYVVHAAHTSSPKIYDIVDRVYVDGPVGLPLDKLRPETLHPPTYYSTLVYARILRKTMRFDEERARFVVE